MPRQFIIPRNIRLSNLYNLTRLRMMAQTYTPKKPVKVLMLHGYTQSGPLFQAKTGALRKTLQKSFPAGITLHYPTAPIRLSPADVPFATSGSNGEVKNGEEEETDAWAWWRRKGDTAPITYEGIEVGLGHIAEVLKNEGPFDGVVGFSQGGACAAMVASLLEAGRKKAFEDKASQGAMKFPESFDSGSEAIHPPLKFAVSYSGFIARDTHDYDAFYDPKISTPMLHFLGTLDAVVEEARSLALVNVCENSEGRVVYHPGGHFLPSTQKAYVAALIGFIKEIMHNEEVGPEKEENVEDMDVPF